MKRTIIEKVCSILSHAKLPKSFWGEAVNTGVYLINLSPSIPLDGDVPLWKFKGVGPPSTSRGMKYQNLIARQNNVHFLAILKLISIIGYGVLLKERLLEAQMLFSFNWRHTKIGKIFNIPWRIAYNHESNSFSECNWLSRGRVHQDDQPHHDENVEHIPQQENQSSHESELQRSTRDRRFQPNWLEVNINYLLKGEN